MYISATFYYFSTGPLACHNIQEKPQYLHVESDNWTKINIDVILTIVSSDDPCCLTHLHNLDPS
jgi:hypothetical protein